MKNSHYYRSDLSSKLRSIATSVQSIRKSKNSIEDFWKEYKSSFSDAMEEIQKGILGKVYNVNDNTEIITIISRNIGTKAENISPEIRKILGFNGSTEDTNLLQYISRIMVACSTVRILDGHEFPFLEIMPDSLFDAIKSLGQELGLETTTKPEFISFKNTEGESNNQEAENEFLKVLILE